MGRGVTVALASAATAALAMTTACVQTHPLACGDVICPPDFVCFAERSLCVSPVAAAACDGRLDGEPCTSSTGDGSCAGGLCVPSVCGDSAATGNEQCDGAPTLACRDFGFYGGTTTCTTSCLHDTSACSGRCGDGIVQTEEGEVCDGAPPTEQCTGIGYDYGHLHCTARCGDTGRVDCGHVGVEPIYEAGGVAISDVWRDGELFVLAFGGGGLAIQDHGITTDTPGTFVAIAARDGTVVTSDGAAVYRIEHGALVPVPALPFTLAPGTTSRTAIAPDGTIWFLADDCHVATLAGSTWTVPALLGGTSCSALAIDGSNHVYAIVAAPGVSHVERFTSGGWVPVPLAGPARALADGGGDTTLAITDLGIQPITGAAPGAVIAGDFPDAVGTNAGILAIKNGALTRLGAVPQLRLDPVSVPLTHVRRSPTGGALAWSTRVYAIDTLTELVPEALTTSGLIALPGNDFLLWDGNALGTFANEQVVTFNAAVESVAADAGGQLYVATIDGLFTGRFGGMFSGDAQVHPLVVWSDPAGNLAVVDSNSVKTRAVGALAWTVLRPADPCTVREIEGTSYADLYVLVQCADADRIEHFVNQDGTVVFTRPAATPPGAYDHAVTLPDGTVVFGGEQVVVGRGTTWTTLSTSATSVAGTSPTDLWLAGASVSPLAAVGLVHWDGTTLAPIEHLSTMHAATLVAVNRQTVITGSRSQRLALARLVGP